MGCIEALNAATNVILQNPTVQKKLASTVSGQDFLDSWATISATVDLATVGTALATFKRTAPQVLDEIDNFVPEGSLGIRNIRRLAKGGSRHPNWVEITDITNKVESRLSHVDALDFKGNGFQGCHTQNAMDEFLKNNPGYTGGFIDANGNPITLMDDAVVEAYPWVKDANGNLFTKTNGAQKIINGVQYGKASFFPKNWNTAKLKAEVEYAISNNHGLVTGNTYRGFSTDGTIEIWFYYNTSNGSIISFFPKVN